MTNRTRRGVLLLVVLALLAMFAMVAVAFVVLTGAEKRTADRLRTIDAVVDSPDKTLNQAFNVVVRGTPINPIGEPARPPLPPSRGKACWRRSTASRRSAPRSPGDHEPDAAPLVCNGQLIEFTLPPNNPDPTTLRQRGRSIRFIMWAASDDAQRPRRGPEHAHRGHQSADVTTCRWSPSKAAFSPQQRRSVHRQRLSLQRHGFRLQSEQRQPVAVGAAAEHPAVELGSDVRASNGIIPGGVNSDYTAADYQDPLVALAVPNPNNGGISVPIPSLHRADLIAHRECHQQYHEQCHHIAAGDVPAQFHRSPQLHRQQSEFQSAVGRRSRTTATAHWDVDNDGDGVPDSVWVDLGLPVRYTTDGRAYKPLFAILCLDMDGRLNLNAHGSLRADASGATISR